MTRLRCAALLLALFITDPGFAAPPKIDWESSARTTVSKARRDNRPMMFWVFGRRRDRNEELESDQIQAFMDIDVVRWSQRFVPCRLNVDRDADLLLEVDLQPSPALNQVVFFADPNLVRLGEIVGARQAAQPAALVRAMEQAFAAYGERVLEEIKPVLENENAEDDRIAAALELVAELNISEADELVVGLLERKNLDARLRRDCYELLARFATKGGIQALFKEMRGEDRSLARYAERALDDAPLPAVEHLYEYLTSEDQATQLAAYELIGDKAGVRATRSAQYMERMSSDERKAEIVRVFEGARQAVEEYKQEERERRRRAELMAEQQQRERYERHGYKTKDYDDR